MTDPRPPYFTPRDDALALLTLTELRSLEARAAAALPPHTLMARAGAAAAQLLLDTRDFHTKKPVWIVAGPGNNGGDALVMAERLHRAGVTVRVCMPVEVKPDDARWALEAARAAGVTIDTEVPASFDEFGWLIDGMFGIGLTRVLDGVFADIATRLSQSARDADSRDHGRVLALDVPSGLDSDTGAPVAGGASVRANETITFIGAKPGHFTAEGRDLCGTLHVATLDIEPPAAPSIVLNVPALSRPTCRRATTRPTKARSARLP